MAINNPLSKTYFKFTKERLQHYSKDKYRCDDCGHLYHPKVHSQPYVVQFAAIAIGIAIFIVFKTQASPLLYRLFPILFFGYMSWYYSRYYNKDRYVATSESKKKIRYGDIVLGCPKCHSKSATKSR